MVTPSWPGRPTRRQGLRPSPPWPVRAAHSRLVVAPFGYSTPGLTPDQTPPWPPSGRDRSSPPGRRRPRPPCSWRRNCDRALDPIVSARRAGGGGLVGLRRGRRRALVRRPARQLPVRAARGRARRRWRPCGVRVRRAHPRLPPRARPAAAAAAAGRAGAAHGAGRRRRRRLRGRPRERPAAASAVVSAVSAWAPPSSPASADADTYHVDRDGDIVARGPSPTSATAHRPDPGSAKASRRCRGVPERGAAAGPDRRPGAGRRRAGAADGPLLRPAAGHRMGHRERQLYLLQSRPITSLAQVGRPGRRLNLWDNSNIAESYNGVTTPLTFSFARRVYEEVYRQFCRMLRRAGGEDRGQRRRVPPHARPGPRPGLLQPAQLVPRCWPCCPASRSTAASWSR